MTLCELNIINGKPVFVQENQIEYPHKWDKPTLKYRILRGTEDMQVKDKLRMAVGLAFSTWGTEIPLKFRHANKHEVADITIRFENNPNADSIFIGKSTVLAYAYYPKTIKAGIIVFNDYSYEWGTRDEKVRGAHVYNACEVLIHELGHILGLSHDSSAGKDVMDAYYDGSMNILSTNDIDRIRKKYGTRVFHRLNLYSRLKRIISVRKKRL